MRGIWRNTLSALTFALTLAACSAPPSMLKEQGAFSQARAATTTTCQVPPLYVAERGAKAVAVFDGNASGEVSPLRTISGASTGLEDVWGVTFDASGHLFAQSYLSSGLLQVFAPGASGNLSPVRTLSAGPDARAVAVDPQGYTYVATGQWTQQINVYAPEAKGDPASGYNVPPVRIIDLPAPYAVGFTPGSLSTDPLGRLLVAAQSANGNAVLTFGAGADGSSTPVRVLSGPNTNLGATSAVSYLPFTVTYSPLTGRIYTATSDGAQTRINVFASNATGDMAPLRTISGPATGLSGQVVTDIANDQCRGNIYVLASDALFTGKQANVLVFNRLDNGNVTPLRLFTDKANHLADSMGIAFAP